jgi:hypothetical protein
MTKQLFSIPERALQDCSKDLQKHLKQCTDAGGRYFEGDSQHESVNTSYSFLYNQSWNFPEIECNKNLPNQAEFQWKPTPH